jgi:hypothetical protein
MLQSHDLLLLGIETTVGKELSVSLVENRELLRVGKEAGTGKPSPKDRAVGYKANDHEEC